MRKARSVILVVVVLAVMVTTAGDGFISTDNRPERGHYRQQLEMILGAF